MPEAEHDDGPLVSDPTKANKTEQTGGWGTGTQGSSTVAGLNEVEDSEERFHSRWLLAAKYTAKRLGQAFSKIAAGRGLTSPASVRN